jgi:hypothetical protein
MTRPTFPDYPKVMTDATGDPFIIFNGMRFNVSQMATYAKLCRAAVTECRRIKATNAYKARLAREQARLDKFKEEIK